MINEEKVDKMSDICLKIEKIVNKNYDNYGDKMAVYSSLIAGVIFNQNFTKDDLINELQKMVCQLYMSQAISRNDLDISHEKELPN